MSVNPILNKNIFITLEAAKLTANENIIVATKALNDAKNKAKQAKEEGVK